MDYSYVALMTLTWTFMVCLISSLKITTNAAIAGLRPRCWRDVTDHFSCLSDGFQLLHAVYAVEHFLQGLLQRKAVFHIVFFNTHRDLCVPRATSSLRRDKYLLARAIIIRHLTVHLRTSHPTIKVLTFASPFDSSFQDYLLASGAYFIMTHDGANLVDIERDRSAIEGSPDLDFAAVEREELQRRAKFRSAILSFLDHGYNVALIDGLEWMDTKVSSTTENCPRTI